MKSAFTPIVPALVKALDILEYLAAKGAPASVKELAADLDIPVATAYRTVKYLTSRRYLVESPRAEGFYEFGPQISYLAYLYTKQTSLIVEARTALRELADISGQTSQLGVLQDFGVAYIDQCLPTKPVSIIATLRTVVPVNLSACGKVLVAHLPDGERETFLQKAPLVAQTRKSVVEPDRFAEELEMVRTQGYALDHEEYARGIGCVAAPIWDYRQQIVGAIGITGHVAEYNDPDRLAQLIGWVESAARAVSTRMGVAEDASAILAAGAPAQGVDGDFSHPTSDRRSEETSGTSVHRESDMDEGG
ncbi:MAG: IclR family transcriptional regulator [Anaerolineae bacterium]